MDERPDAEVLDLGEGFTIDLRQSREWPHYVVEWSLRRRQGDSDYPVASGRVARMPEGDAEALLAGMREDALTAARSHLPPEQPHPSWLRRLFG